MRISERGNGRNFVPLLMHGRNTIWVRSDLCERAIGRTPESRMALSLPLSLSTDPPHLTRALLTVRPCWAVIRMGILFNVLGLTKQKNLEMKTTKNWTQNGKSLHSNSRLQEDAKSTLVWSQRTCRIQSSRRPVFLNHKLIPEQL